MAATVEVVLNAKDNASEALGKVGSGISGLASAAGTLATGGLVAIGGGLAAVGGAALKTSGEIDQATRDIASKLGITTEEAGKFEETMTGVFANNFGENFADIGEGIVTMQQQLREVAPASQEAQQAMLEGAFAIRDAFGVDLEETFNATGALMRDFGLSSEEAMDFVTAGLQGGLNASGDFLDSITEYAPQFSNAGADAGQFFSLMESGMQGGVLGTDKAADAFKEFTVRIQDGSKTTAEGLAAIGIDAEELSAKMADGTVSQVEAWDMFIGKLQETDDKNVQMQAGVALLGTQFEDLGTKGTLALDTTGTKLEDMAGSTDKLNQQYDNFGSMMEGTWRQILVAMQPFIDSLMEIANDAMPHVQSFLQDKLTPAIETLAKWMAEDLPKVIDDLNKKWDAFNKAMEPIVKFVKDTLIPAFEDIVEVLIGNTVAEAIQQVADFFENTLVPAAQAVTDFFNDTLVPAFEKLVEVVETVVGEMKALWDEHGEQIKEIVKLYLEFLTELFKEIFETIQEVIDVALKAIRFIWDNWGEEITAAVKLVWDGIKELIDFALDQIQNVLELGIALLTGDWEKAWDEIKEIVDRAWELIESGIRAAWPTIKQAVQAIVDGIKKAFKDSIAGFKTIGQDMMGGIKAGIAAKKDEVLGSLKDVGDSAIAKMKFWDRSDSPSKRWAEDVGEPWMEGIILGLRNKMPDLLRQVQIIGVESVRTMKIAIEEPMPKVFEKAAQASLDRWNQNIFVVKRQMRQDADDMMDIWRGFREDFSRVIDDAFDIRPPGPIPRQLRPGEGGGDPFAPGAGGGRVPSGFNRPRVPTPGPPTIGGGVNNVTINIDKVIGTDEEAANNFSKTVANQLQRECAF